MQLINNNFTNIEDDLIYLNKKHLFTIVGLICPHLFITCDSQSRFDIDIYKSYFIAAYDHSS